MTHLLDVYETGNQEITHGPIAHLLGFCQIVILYVNAMVMNLSITFNSKKNWQNKTHIFLYMHYVIYILRVTLPCCNKCMVFVKSLPTF